MSWSFGQKALLENKKLNASFIYSNFKENLYHWVVLCKRLWTDNAWRTADHMKYSIRTQYYLKNTSSDILTCLRKQQRDGRFCKMSSVGIPYDVIMQEFLPLLLRQRTTQGPQIYNFDWLYQDSSDFLSYISIKLNDTRQATLAVPIRAFLKIFTKYLGSDNWKWSLTTIFHPNISLRSLFATTIFLNTRQGSHPWPTSMSEKWRQGRNI